MRKRIISAALVLVLVLTILPAAAFAASWCSYSVERVDRSVTKSAGGYTARVLTYYDLVSVSMANQTVQGRINSALRAQMNAFFTEADDGVQMYLFDSASIRSAAQQQRTNGKPYLHYVQNESVFVNRNYISVKNISTWFYGGTQTHGYYCATVDLKSGAVVTLPQYLGMTDASTKTFVRNALKAKGLNDSISEFYLKNTAPSDYKYYLDANGRMHLVFNTNEVGPSYMGPQDLLTGAPSAAQPDFFVDVDPNGWYTDAIDWASTHTPQITNGTSPTTFSPDAACTRGQMVTFLWRAKGCPEPKTKTSPFSDVKGDEYYGKAVLWAAENGIAQGMGGGRFAPDATVTRGQTVTFLWRMEGQTKATGSNPFRDVPTSEYYYQPVLWAVAHQITNGTTANTFSPNEPCTRAQIVTFLYRDLA